MMDDLVQHIAGQVGRRWVQLYSRLGLGPRERYRFECDHKDKQEEDKWRSCALGVLYYIIVEYEGYSLVPRPTPFLLSQTTVV